MPESDHDQEEFHPLFGCVIGFGLAAGIFWILVLLGVLKYG